MSNPVHYRFVRNKDWTVVCQTNICCKRWLLKWFSGECERKQPAASKHSRIPCFCISLSPRGTRRLLWPAARRRTRGRAGWTRRPPPQNLRPNSIYMLNIMLRVTRRPKVLESSNITLIIMFIGVIKLSPWVFYSTSSELVVVRMMSKPSGSLCWQPLISISPAPCPLCAPGIGRIRWHLHPFFIT